MTRITLRNWNPVSLNELAANMNLNSALTYSGWPGELGVGVGRVQLGPATGFQPRAMRQWKPSRSESPRFEISWGFEQTNKKGPRLPRAAVATASWLGWKGSHGVVVGLDRAAMSGSRPSRPAVQSQPTMRWTHWPLITLTECCGIGPCSKQKHCSAPEISKPIWF